jgi:hypothetical protein
LIYMSLKVPGRAGACKDMAERQSHHIPDSKRTPHEGGNGAPGLPRTVHESANPPPESRAYPTLPQKSALNRAVEWTRDLYERNGWAVLPLGEAENTSSSLSNQPPLSEDFYQRLRERLRQISQEPAQEKTERQQTVESPHGEGSNGAELTNEEIRKSNEEFFEKLRRIGDPERRKQFLKELMEGVFPQDPEEEK